MSVTFYTTHCPKCAVLQSKLKAKGIDYTENSDVQEMISLGFKSAPLLKVDDQVMDFATAVKWVNAYEG